VLVIRSQQRQLQRLGETTARLAAELESLASSSSSTTATDACERSVVDGALTALHEYFSTRQAATNP